MRRHVHVVPGFNPRSLEMEVWGNLNFGVLNTLVPLGLPEVCESRRVAQAGTQCLGLPTDNAHVFDRCTLDEDCAEGLRPARLQVSFGGSRGHTSPNQCCRRSLVDPRGGSRGPFCSQQHCFDPHSLRAHHWTQFTTHVPRNNNNSNNTT